eukprot:GHVT01094672.1.p4 GENE.GHVT01094672.1~~GHVT01094672.1.p4  ORF type:complete len:102 (-),score=20.49 GHVT01094672.1:236-541(-)
MDSLSLVDVPARATPRPHVRPSPLPQWLFSCHTRWSSSASSPVEFTPVPHLFPYFLADDLLQWLLPALSIFPSAPTAVSPSHPETRASPSFPLLRAPPELY